MKRKTPPVSRAVTFWKVLNLIFIEIAGEIHTDTHSHSSDLFSQDKCASVVAFHCCGISICWDVCNSLLVEDACLLWEQGWWSLWFNKSSSCEGFSSSSSHCVKGTWSHWTSVRTQRGNGLLRKSGQAPLWLRDKCFCTTYCSQCCNQNTW